LGALRRLRVLRFAFWFAPHAPYLRLSSFCKKRKLFVARLFVARYATPYTHTTDFAAFVTLILDLTTPTLRFCPYSVARFTHLSYWWLLRSIFAPVTVTHAFAFGSRSHVSLRLVLSATFGYVLSERAFAPLRRSFAFRLIVRTFYMPFAFAFTVAHT